MVNIVHKTNKSMSNKQGGSFSVKYPLNLTYKTLLIETESSWLISNPGKKSSLFYLTGLITQVLPIIG